MVQHARTIHVHRITRTHTLQVHCTHCTRRSTHCTPYKYTVLYIVLHRYDC
jgi:hypothetical protein